MCSIIVLGGIKKFEKFFNLKVGNKTLDEVRRKYKVNGMNSIAEVMPQIGDYSGWGILRNIWDLGLELITHSKNGFCSYFFSFNMPIFLY